MRLLFPLIVLLAAQIGAAWANGEPNVARPGGAFNTMQTNSAAACERLCADDGLCMAWSFRGNACELKAIVPSAVAQSGTISGVSSRAPASMRTRTEVVPAVTPARIARESAPASTIASAEDGAEDDMTLALLGGPETEETLRSRLGN